MLLCRGGHDKTLACCPGACAFTRPRSEHFEDSSCTTFMLHSMRVYLHVPCMRANLGFFTKSAEDIAAQKHVHVRRGMSIHGAYINHGTLLVLCSEKSGQDIVRMQCLDQK